MREEKDFIPKDAIYSRDKIFFAKRDVIDEPVYSIYENELSLKEPDIIAKDHEYYFPRDTEILYCICKDKDTVITSFGKDFTKEALAMIISIVDKLDMNFVICCTPMADAPPWLDEYNKKLEEIEKTIHSLYIQEQE